MQSRLSSLIEQILNVGSGFLISLIVWMYVIVPIWDFEVTLTENLAITIIFTVVSVIRGYAWRRIFNRIHSKETNNVHKNSQ
jgi:hypothetical protein